MDILELAEEHFLIKKGQKMMISLFLVPCWVTELWLQTELLYVCGNIWFQKNHSYIYFIAATFPLNVLFSVKFQLKKTSHMAENWTDKPVIDLLYLFVFDIIYLLKAEPKRVHMAPEPQGEDQRHEV